MARIKELISGAVFGEWGTAHRIASTTQLEEDFDLSTANIGRSYWEVLENKAENRGRKLLTVIPDYSSTFDPHLRSFYKNQKKLQRKAKRKGSPIPGYQPNGQDTQGVTPQSYIISTGQVLALKRLFYKESLSEGGARRVVGREQIVYAINKGADIVKQHRLLHKKSPPAKCPLPKLIATLIALESVDAIDWPTFLLLCTINLGRAKEMRRLLLLKDSHLQYLGRNGIHTEAQFAQLIVHLNGGEYLPSGEPLVLFCQNGDFYSSRGALSSFPEAVFSLYDFFTQVYIMRARGRGDKMHVNFLGHTAPGNVGGPPNEINYNNKTALMLGSPMSTESAVKSKINIHWVP